MAKRTTTTSKPAAAPAGAPLPKGILASDLKYPDLPRGWWDKWEKASKAARAKLDAERERHSVKHTITMYETEASGWLVCTLPISNARPGRGDLGARTYAVTLIGDVHTVGRGPHVKRIVNVYVTAARLPDLQWLVDLYTEGLAKAGTIRDRISTRRADTIGRRGVRGIFGGW